MRVIRWLFLWFPVILIWTNALIFEQNTTTFLKVKEDGFTVKICGNGSQSTKFCYGGLATNEQKQNCSSNSYCGIQALKHVNVLSGLYGEASARFKKKCAEITVKPSEQIALNSESSNPEKGTCKWNVTEDEKLPVDVTVTTGFDVRVITKDEMNTMSENYLFQNPHACSKKEWKMYFGPVEQGAEISRELRKLAEEYYGGMHKIYEDELGFAEKVRIAVRDGCTPGYVWAWSFVQQHKHLFNVRVEDVIKEWDINGLALLLFSNITDKESAAVLREIKMKACDLINMHGERSDQTALYPIPLFHLINQKYGDECHVLPSEYPNMPIPPAPMVEERPTITLVDDDQRVAFPPEQPIKPGQKTLAGMDTFSQTIVEAGSSTGGTTTVEKPPIV